jgi:very-short-patch-repair endonuclease
MNKQSTPEALALKVALEGLNIRVHAELWDGHKHIDLTIPDAHINIEIDGVQHLTDPYQILADISRAHYSDELGYNTLHIHNDEIRSNLEKVAVAIAEAAKIQQAKLEGKKGWVELD